MHLEDGTYEIGSATGRIRVTVNESSGEANVDLRSYGTRADVTVNDTPHNNFRATIEVPTATHLRIHFDGGNLTVGAVARDMDIAGAAENISVDVDANAFNRSRSGLFRRLTWSGVGTDILRVRPGVGNLELRTP
jgi:hypothetical protein